MRDRKFEWLEVMRGLAAVWVLLHHASQSVTHFVGSIGVVPMITNGYLGVDFFFVLSGFIIASSSRGILDKGGGVRDYVWARAIRIYVPYLPVGLGLYLLYLALPGLSQGDRSPSLFTSVSLLPSNDPPALSVAWTLVHEMVFYAIFSVWFYSKRVLWALLLVWALCILVVWQINFELGRFWSYFLSPLKIIYLNIYHSSNSSTIESVSI